MLSGDAVAAVVVQLLTALAAAYGTVRCVRLQRFGSDRRLAALAWFFGLFAVAVALQAAWQVQIGWNAPSFATFRSTMTNGTYNRTGPGPSGAGPFSPQGSENANILLAAHHVLMLASLSVGTWAFSHRSGPDVMGAAAPITFFAFLGDMVPAMLALEAGLALYIAARSLINHVERRSPGAVQVSLGFLFFFLGHLVFTVAHRPGMPRSTLGDVLGLVGIVLLVQVLPRTS